MRLKCKWPNCGIRAYNYYKKCVIPQVLPSVLCVYSHVTQDHNAYVYSEIASTCVAITNYSFFFIENYIHQLDEWREHESIYEDKLDPPKWNTNIVKLKEHNANILLLSAALIANLYSWISVFLQGIAIFISVYKVEIIIDLACNIVLLFL